MGLEKAYLEVEGKNGHVPVMFNPSEYNLSRGVNYAEKKIPGLEGPVTQLDVYKRQDERIVSEQILREEGCHSAKKAQRWQPLLGVWAAIKEEDFYGISNRVQFCASQRLSGPGRSPAQRRSPVSYTHLDVYKRQPWEEANMNPGIWDFKKHTPASFQDSGFS